MDKKVGVVDMERFKQYLTTFEENVMQKLLQTPSPSLQLSREVPVTGGKLQYTDFGKFIGSCFCCEKILAFNYYGLYKLSDTIELEYRKNSITFPGIKVIVAPVVNFASILPVDIKNTCPDLLSGFADFKEFIVNIRWNNKGVL